MFTMEADTPLRVCENNVGCPRTAMILKLIADKDMQRVGELQAMELQPTAQSISRVNRLRPILEKLTAESGEEQPVIPATCPLFGACEAAVNELQKQMFQRSGGLGMLGLRQFPTSRQF